ncbi:class I SAM-dependent methyltransferase [Pseudomonadota bacterium]
MVHLKPGRSDVSRPVEERDYQYKKQFYQDDSVAADYDSHRFEGKRRALRNQLKWAAIQSALKVAQPVKTILDIPCGTGRFTPMLAQQGYHIIGADISVPMMIEALKLGSKENLYGYVQADAETLPFPENSLDCILSIRFMHHIDPATRILILRDMARVSSRWVIVDYRHRYSFRYRMRAIKLKLGLTRRVLPRVSRDELNQEFSAAGINIVKVIPVGRFSDKWIVVGDCGN